MLSLETGIQLDVKLLWESEQIDDLAAVSPELGRDVVRPFPFDTIALQAMGHMVMEVGARFFACERRRSEEMARRQTEDTR